MVALANSGQIAAKLMQILSWDLACHIESILHPQEYPAPTDGWRQLNMFKLIYACPLPLRQHYHF